MLILWKDDLIISRMSNFQKISKRFPNDIFYWMMESRNIQTYLCFSVDNNARWWRSYFIFCHCIARLIVDQYKSRNIQTIFVLFCWQQCLMMEMVFHILPLRKPLHCQAYFGPIFTLRLEKNKIILKRNEFSPERGIPPLFGPQRCRSPWRVADQYMVSI